MTELSRPGFAVRYAVRMPNGELYCRVPQQQQQSVDFWIIPSPLRDMMGIVEPASGPPPQPKPEIFEKLADAEALLKQLQDKAAAMGVSLWGGVVVSQLCTPFSSGDAAVEFAAEISAWLAEQDGAL